MSEKQKVGVFRMNTIGSNLMIKVFSNETAAKNELKNGKQMEMGANYKIYEKQIQDKCTADMVIE